MRKAVKVLAIIATVGCIIFSIFACTLLSNKVMDWIYFIAMVAAMSINLLLLWALYNALSRIEGLERKVYRLDEKEKERAKLKVVDDPNPYRQCSNCGSIRRTGEKVCPNCNTPYDDTDK